MMVCLVTSVVFGSLWVVVYVMLESGSLVVVVALVVVVVVLVVLVLGAVSAYIARFNSRAPGSCAKFNIVLLLVLYSLITKSTSC